MRLMLAALGLLAARTASAAYCHGAPDPSAKPNLHPIQGKPPVHVRAVSNGLLETAGEGDELISIVHLWGTAYERGVAHGSLMKADVGEFIPAALAFFAEQAALAINGTAKWIPPSVGEQRYELAQQRGRRSRLSYGRRRKRRQGNTRRN